MAKSTRFGRKEQEEAWKNTEVDALYRLAAAGVRVPRPFGFFEGVLVMEFVTDSDGQSAPRLGEVELNPEQARAYHQFLISQVVRMLCTGLIHGDLSGFNVLVGPDGPVIIDLPQAVDASSNNNAFAMLERDVRNLTDTLGRFAPELLPTQYATEMWSLFERGELKPESELTGIFIKDDTVPDLEDVIGAIDDAREEAIRRQRGRDEAKLASGE